MDVKSVIFAVIMVFLASSAVSRCQAVNTGPIDIVRDKGVLDSSDLQIIDNFVAEAVKELVNTIDFSSIARIRSVILTRSSSTASSSAVQYAEQFNESAYKNISAALEQILQLSPAEEGFKTITNLLILINGLEDLRLTELAAGLLNSGNMVVRYWAVCCVTDAAIVAKLNAGEAGDPQLARRIIEQLEKLLDSDSPEIIAMTAEFAAGVNIPQGKELLVYIADMRMRKYADWTVEYELLDSTVLNLLCDRITAAGPSEPETARCFGQLFSYCLQRYIKGQHTLTDEQKQLLASALVETEKSCIGKIMGMSQTVIKRTVETGNMRALLDEHNRLLGTATGAGQLSEKLKINYAKSGGGVKRDSPFILPEPPLPAAGRGESLTGSSE